MKGREIEMWVGLDANQEIYTVSNSINDAYFSAPCRQARFFMTREDAARRHGIIAKATIRLSDISDIEHCPYKGDPDHCADTCRLGRHEKD
jgi:hypothetical protein